MPVYNSTSVVVDNRKSQKEATMTEADKKRAARIKRIREEKARKAAEKAAKEKAKAEAKAKAKAEAKKSKVYTERDFKGNRGVSSTAPVKNRAY